MLYFDEEGQAVKGWLAGPWNSNVPIAVGYANEGINEPHSTPDYYHFVVHAPVVEGDKHAPQSGDQQGE